MRIMIRLSYPSLMINSLILFENFFKQLTELNKISTVGPFISMINDPQINMNNMREYGNVLINYQRYLNKYLTQMINSYFLALDKVSAGIKEKMHMKHEC